MARSNRYLIGGYVLGAPVNAVFMGPKAAPRPSPAAAAAVAPLHVATPSPSAAVANAAVRPGLLTTPRPSAANVAPAGPLRVSPSASAGSAQQAPALANATSSLARAASHVSPTAQRLRTAASKSKKLKRKVNAIADALDGKVRAAQSKVTQQVHGLVIGDLSAANMAVNTGALERAAQDLIAKGSEAEAIVIATDINTEMGDYTMLFSEAKRSDLAQQATDFGNRAYDLVTAYNPTTGDPTLPGKVAALQGDSNAWFRTAGPVLHAAQDAGLVPSGASPGAGAGASGGTATGAPTIASVVDVSNPAANAPPSPYGSPYGGPAASGAAAGDSVTITGAHFTGVTQVLFGGVPAQFTVVSDTQITAFVPPGAQTGPVQVVNALGTATSPGVFYINAGGGFGDPSGGGGGYGGGGGGGGGGDPFADDGGGMDAGDEPLADGDIDWGDGQASADPGDGGGATDDGAPADDSNIDWGDGSAGETMNNDNAYVLGAAVLGAELDDDDSIIDSDDYQVGADTIPKAVSYTDQPTVLAVQAALSDKGYNPGPLDGIFGPKTSAAIKKMQKDASIPQTGVVDYGVLSALKVKAPAYTPTTTTAGRSASAAAKDADENASHATTPAAVQAASQQVEAANAVALPPPPPDVQAQVATAAAAARAATTPAEVKAAATQVQAAAQAVVAAQSFWGAPLWTGAPIRRWQGAVGLGAGSAVVVALALIARRR